MGRIEGDEATLLVDRPDSFGEDLELEFGFRPGSPSFAHRHEQVPNHPFGGGEVLGGSGAFPVLFDPLVKAVVSPEVKGIWWGH